MSRILIVDECARDRRYGREVLEVANHRVLEADSWDLAVAALLRERVDMVLIDPEIPGTRPGELGRYIAAQAPDGPRFLLFSYMAASQLVDLADSMGAHGYFIKGEDATTLLDLVGGKGRRASAGDEALEEGGDALRPPHGGVSSRPLRRSPRSWAEERASD